MLSVLTISYACDHKAQLQREILRISRRFHALLSEKTTDSTYHPLILCIRNACWANLPILIILPADCGGFFWHFYKSNGNLPSSAPAEVAWAGRSLWCASASWDSPALCACAHTHIQHSQIEGKIHLLKAGMQGLHSSVMTALMCYNTESLKSGIRRDPQCIFGGAALIPEVPVPMGSEKGAPFRTTPRTQPGTGEGTQVALHVWTPLSTLPERTNHEVKFVHSSWPGTWCMLICISYFFGYFIFLSRKDCECSG